MKIIVLIVTYNGSNWIKNCIQSLNQSNINKTICVIDNFSSDDTIRIISSDFPDVKLIKLESNIGFGKANNIGLNYGLSQGFDYFFLLNQDTLVSEGLLGKLIKSYRENNIFGILSPIHFDGSGENFDINFEYFLKIQKKTRILSELINRDRFLNDKCFEVEFINAASWFLSKEVLLSVGVFNPIFPHYGEDTDFYNRLIFHKGKSYIFTGGFINHFSLHSYQSNKFELIKRFDREKVEIWANLLNINKSMYSIFLSILFKKLKRVLIFLFNFKRNDFFLEVLLLVNMTVKSFTIFRMRFESKKKGSFLKI